MARHVAQLSVASALVVVCVLLPYLPGGYDRFAATLSTMAQLFGVAGLVVAPLAALWTVLEMSRVARMRAARPAGRGCGRAAAITVVTFALASALASLAAFAMSGLSLWFAILAALAFVCSRFVVSLRSTRAEATPAFNASPVYLAVLPAVAAICTFALVPTASERARKRAMAHARPLIADIEKFRREREAYPVSLQAVWGDYPTGVISVQQYHYEPSGESYNLFFEHFAVPFGTREFIMYNPRDEQEMTSHAMNLLRCSPGELRLRRGYYSVRETGEPHWKSFSFD